VARGIDQFSLGNYGSAILFYQQQLSVSAVCSVCSSTTWMTTAWEGDKSIQKTTHYPSSIFPMPYEIAAMLECRTRVLEAKGAWKDEVGAGRSCIDQLDVLRTRWIS